MTSANQLNSALYYKWRKRLLPSPILLDEEWSAELRHFNLSILPDQNRKEFNGSTPLNKELVLSMLTTSGFYCERIPEMLPYLRGLINPGQYVFRTLNETLHGTFGLFHRPIDSPDFKAHLKRIFGTENPDCKERATIFFASFLAMMKYWQNAPAEIIIRLETGLVFDKNYAPEGQGHAWIKIDDQLIEAAIVPKGELILIKEPYKYYIPIASQRLAIDVMNCRAKGEPFICAMPTMGI